MIFEPEKFFFEGFFFDMSMMEREKQFQMGGP